jgi:chromosome segregation ATPase
MYENETVVEEEAKKLANELNAIFITTSAKSSKGIEDLFLRIGKRFLNPKSDKINNSEDNKKNKLSNKIMNKTPNTKEDKKIIKDDLNNYKNEIKHLKDELDNYRKMNEKLKKELNNHEKNTQVLKDQLNGLKIFKENFKEIKNSYEKEIKKLKDENVKLGNELAKVNKIKGNLEHNNKTNEKGNDNFNEINYLKEIIKSKEKEIDFLNIQIKNIENDNKKLVDFDNIMVVNFISSDQKINYGIKCLKTDTFAEIEEKLYQTYEEFRETNNNFIAKGKLILRFKKICDNDIKDGDIVQLIKIE